MRLINADILPNYEVDVIARVGDAAGPAKMRFVLWEDIQKAPVIDAKPVVHAYWKKTYDLIDGHDGYECSACGYTKYFDHYAKGIALCKPFCCECGAKMDAKGG